MLQTSRASSPTAAPQVPPSLASAPLHMVQYACEQGCTVGKAPPFSVINSMGHSQYCRDSAPRPKLGDQHDASIYVFFIGAAQQTIPR